MSQSASLEACYPVVVFHRIERGDYSYGMTASGLLPRASVEHGKRLSSHRRSTGTAHDRRLTLSPYPGWWPGLPGVLPDRKNVALRLRQLTTAEQRSATGQSSMGGILRHMFSEFLYGLPRNTQYLGIMEERSRVARPCRYGKATCGFGRRAFGRWLR